jgi:hypothetical protein
MAVYDPLNQGYMHDWRLDEAVRVGVRRATRELSGELRDLVQELIDRVDRRPPEGWEVLRVLLGRIEALEERLVRSQEEVIRALEQRIVALIRENMELKEKLRKYEESGRAE